MCIRQSLYHIPVNLSCNLSLTVCNSFNFPSFKQFDEVNKKWRKTYHSWARKWSTKKKEKLKKRRHNNNKIKTNELRPKISIERKRDRASIPLNQLNAHPFGNKNLHLLETKIWAHIEHWYDDLIKLPCTLSCWARRLLFLSKFYLSHFTDFLHDQRDRSILSALYVHCIIINLHTHALYTYCRIYIVR